MQKKELHIVSFENPFPPDFGGVIDVFYKVKALHSLGFSIYLHCYYEDRSEVSQELKAIAEKVYLYKKNKNPFFVFSKYPLPVICRFDKDLIENIRKHDAPILFEGLHSTMILRKAKLDNKKYLRLHNIESNFYSGMSKSETSLVKKILYYFVAKKYLSYQKTIADFDFTFALSCYELDEARKLSVNCMYVPVFHGNEINSQLSEYGKYAFYHGDLRLADNKRAAQFLIEVFKEIPDYELIIASSNGKQLIENKIKNVPNVKFVEIQSFAHLSELFENAHINTMLSFQESGTKLKVINSLFKSRFCLINKNMVDDVNLLSLCETAESKMEFVNKIKFLKDKPYTQNDKRKAVLLKVLNDTENAKLIEEKIEYY
ncbi:hypothetical protein L1S35_12245 [Flavobacterium sp. AS60]|uniref:hypothetical protein n=1 Tax=Flavobacterium anseongense TaxID=2910677 RepID=UPI001F31114A|nr:hypothetical protein [Flavobacterium sp. AS60]MCF6130447.1 hypothetical protein [Flavobacterium sp. AS60]